MREGDREIHHRRRCIPGLGRRAELLGRDTTANGRSNLSSLRLLRRRRCMPGLCRRVELLGRDTPANDAPRQSVNATITCQINFLRDDAAGRARGSDDRGGGGQSGRGGVRRGHAACGLAM